MFFVDKPYVSEFFKKTVCDHGIPVVGTNVAGELDLHEGTRVISEAEAIELVREAENPAIYTTSENSIAWISRNLPFSGLPAMIDQFKNKLSFRELTNPMFPGFYFKGVHVEELRNIRVYDLPLPFVIKPASGFFSMGVYKVTDYTQWPGVADSILTEISRVKGLYPEEVLNTSSFIIEHCIDGEEFAFDAYFNINGEVVMLGIFKHVFSSDSDVSDRVYVTSAEIIRDNIDEFTLFLEKIGELTGARNFPVHVELRRGDDGRLLPIEINPMRFGGWCTTADATCLAYGFNPYLCFHSQTKPDWEQALKEKEGRFFSIVVLDNSTGLDASAIASFDYEKLLSGFEKPLELRKTDYAKYPVFGFLFTETRQDNFVELKEVLDSDLVEFVSPN